MREFKDSVTGKDAGDDDDRPELSKAEAGEQPADREKVPADPAKPSADAS
jgi:hypothetical protein